MRLYRVLAERESDFAAGNGYAQGRYVRQDCNDI